MPSRAVLFATSALAGAAFVAAQAAPNWMYIPAACASECSATVKSSYTCQNQFQGDTTSIYGCFCSNYPSDADTCASCLNSHDAAALASLLTSTKTACPEAEKKCFFQCSFDTCASTDIPCQCAASYLQNIYNCASCNTANGNTDATQISNFNALQESCKNQNYTGASQSFTTEALPAANTANYNAPTLTATGGGVAATGDASDASGALAATGNGSGSNSAAATPAGNGGSAAATTGAAGGSSGGSSTGGSASGGSAAGGSAAGGSAAGGAAAGGVAAGSTGAVVAAGTGVSGGAVSGAAASSGSGSSATPTGGAVGLAAPALGGLLGIAGAVAALL